MGFAIIKDNEYLLCSYKNTTTNENTSTKIHIPCFVGLSCSAVNLLGGCCIPPLDGFGFVHGFAASYCIDNCFLSQRLVIIASNESKNNQTPVIVNQPQPQPINSNETIKQTDANTIRHR